MSGITGLLLNVGQNKLGQDIFIDRMNRTGAFAASGIAATHKGTVTPRSAVLIGKDAASREVMGDRNYFETSEFSCGEIRSETASGPSLNFSAHALLSGNRNIHSPPVIMQPQS